MEKKPGRGDVARIAKEGFVTEAKPYLPRGNGNGKGKGTVRKGLRNKKKLWHKRKDCFWVLTVRAVQKRSPEGERRKPRVGGGKNRVENRGVKKKKKGGVKCRGGPPE